MSVNKNTNENRNFDREIGDVINLDYTEGRLINDDLGVKNEPWDYPQSSNFHSIKSEPNSSFSESKFQKIFFAPHGFFIFRERKNKKSDE